MMNRIELKQEAKGVVRTAAVSAYLFALLYLALTELLQGASVYVNGDVVLYMQTYFPNVPIPSYLYPVALPTTAVTLVAVVCWLLRVLLQGGWVLYHLGVRRGEEMPYATLFDGFGFIGKLILLNIVITLYVFLWSMLLIIPGIIAGYRYRFAVYNLCENPDMGVMEESFVTPTLAATPGDLSLVMPKRILDGIIEMIYALDKIAPGTANDDTLLYGVEVKFYNMEVQLDENLETPHKGLFVIGDGSGVTHSLSHASASGVYVARHIAESL